jgi:hypothetical protein
VTARVRNRLVAAGVVALFALPVSLDLALRGWTGVFRYFADDSYLYFAVARNFVEHGFFTSDQVHPANGFHPLWQLLLALLYGVGRGLGLGEPAILVTVFLTSVVFIAVALWCVCRSYAIARGRVPVSFLFLPLGFYGLAAAPFLTGSGPKGALWGFVNGMESGLSLLFYGLLLRVMVRPGFAGSAASALLTGALLSALFLARLDNIFLAVALCGAIGVRALFRRDLALLGRGVLVGLPVLGVLGGYLLLNLATVGIAMPVSGLAKSTAFSLRKLQLIPAAFSEPFPLRGWRLAQLILPTLVAVPALLGTWRPWRRGPVEPLEWALVATALFVLLLGLYDFLFVPLLGQGHWYFPISILFTSLIGLHALDRTRASPFLDSWPAGAAICLGTLAVFALFYAGSRERSPAIFAHFATETAPEAREHYAASAPRILSYDDGIIAYATGWPVMTARGFMLDPEAMSTFGRLDRSLLELAYRRGFDRIAALNYFDASRLRPDSPSRAIRRELRRQLGILPWKLRPFDYQVDFLSRDGRFAIIRMTRKEPPAGGPAP